MRLDESKLEELRRWGQALREAEDEGSVAAGRAISLLTEEIERLRLELERARAELDRLDPGPSVDVDARTGETVAMTLQRRLSPPANQDPDQSLAAPSQSAGETGPRVESDSNTAAGRTWIETLRRQR